MYPPPLSVVTHFTPAEKIGYWTIQGDVAKPSKEIVTHKTPPLLSSLVSTHLFTGTQAIKMSCTTFIIFVI
jgi:hypothetical protein